MLRGCKHYFSMYGLLLFTINALLAKHFCRTAHYGRDHLTVLDRCMLLRCHNDPHRRQIYQKTISKGDHL